MSAFAVVAVVAGGLGLLALILLLVRRPSRIADAVIATPVESTVVDRDGAVRSVQSADLTLPVEGLDAIWTPVHLERLARTYWRYLTRVTLGLVRVEYTAAERSVVLISRPLVLLRFHAPEYAMDARRGIVRWRIESGVLVSRRGRGGDGYLQIDIRRSQQAPAGRATMHVEVVVANFYPAIASGIGTRAYKLTQSKLHVLITQRFLRSLAHLDLAESRVGRFSTTSTAADHIDDVPDPPDGSKRPPEPAAQSVARGRGPGTRG